MQTSKITHLKDTGIIMFEMNHESGVHSFKKRVDLHSEIMFTRNHITFVVECY